MVKFVNPYTFLPLPKAIKRQQPHYHDGEQGQDRPLYTGSFTVEWELKSPLLLPVDAEKEGWLEPLAESRSEAEDKEAPDELRKISIPGSSVKGALRSLHEAAFFGCMSVIDQEYIPAYREGIGKGKRAAKQRGWTIGIVAEVDENHRPTAILPTTGETIWLNAKDLINIPGYRSGETRILPRTGDVIQFAQKGLWDDFGRKKKENLIADATFIGRGEDQINNIGRNWHVVIITHGATRTNAPEWYWASRKIDNGAKRLAVSDAAWESFLYKVAGTDDSRQKKAREKMGDEERLRKQQDNETVAGLDTTLGVRLLQHGEFKVGDALWVQVHGDEVIELSYSAIWRRVAQVDGKAMKVADLLGDLGPCDPNSHAEHGGGICMSCSIFGIVGKENSKGEEGRGYAGHIRIGALHLSDKFTAGALVRSESKFMPLASPKPSNAQFYLTSPTDPEFPSVPSKGEVDEGINMAHWDRGHLGHFEQRLAGRKFYWNHNPLRKPGGTGRVYYRAFAEANKELTSSRKFVLPETEGSPVTFIGEIVFDQITAAELLSLWYLCDHTALFKALGQPMRESSVVRLGGGKPLGFGAAKPRIVGFEVSTIQNRYTKIEADHTGQGGSSSPCGVDDVTEATWLESLVSRVTVDKKQETLAKNIGLLGRVMDLEGLGKDKDFVAYPPNAPWSKYGIKDFHESYAFFMKTNGGAERTKWKDWVPLPPLRKSSSPVIDT